MIASPQNRYTPYGLIVRIGYTAQNRQKRHDLARSAKL
jgi:hypothetical protein